VVTGNTWDHILITGNTISSTAPGRILAIDLLIGGTVGDTLQHSTIANNHIVMQSPGGIGIQVLAGAGLGSTSNQVLDTMIASNVIAGTSTESAIHVGTGVGSASKNSLNGIQIVANQMTMTGPGDGIVIVGGDAASDDMNPPVLPIQYSENNTISNLSILSNTIQEIAAVPAVTGFAGMGINQQESCCGNRNNTLNGLSILGNTISGALNVGVMLNSGSSGGYYSRTTTADALSNVLVQSNTIQMTSPIYNGCNCYPGTMGITFGGIQVWTGSEEPGDSVNGLSILNNEVDTPLVGISVIGGLGGSGALNAPISPADNNVVSGAQISCNQVDQAATVAIAPYTGIKGINVVAGMLNASGNQVQQLSVHDNLVGGVLNDVSLFDYLGSGGSGNSMSLAGASGTINGPQTGTGGLVNAATFQQGALAPGSLVSMFGLNLNGATVQFSATELAGALGVTGRVDNHSYSVGQFDRRRAGVCSRGASRPRYFLPGRASGRTGRHRKYRGSRGGCQLAGPCRGLHTGFRYRAGRGHQPPADRSGSSRNLVVRPQRRSGRHDWRPAGFRQFRGTGSRLYRPLPGERPGAAGSRSRGRRAGCAIDRRHRFESRYHCRPLALDGIWPICGRCSGCGRVKASMSADEPLLAVPAGHRVSVHLAAKRRLMTFARHTAR
jgi:hypothetical protein